jgi:hypothetical protein
VFRDGLHRGRIRHRPGDIPARCFKQGGRGRLVNKREPVGFRQFGQGVRVWRRVSVQNDIPAVPPHIGAEHIEHRGGGFSGYGRSVIEVAPPSRSDAGVSGGQRPEQSFERGLCLVRAQALGRVRVKVKHGHSFPSSRAHQGRRPPLPPAADSARVVCRFLCPVSVRGLRIAVPLGSGEAGMDLPPQRGSGKGEGEAGGGQGGGHGIPEGPAFPVTARKAGGPLTLAASKWGGR